MVSWIMPGVMVVLTTLVLGGGKMVVGLRDDVRDMSTQKAAVGEVSILRDAVRDVTALADRMMAQGTDICAQNTLAGVGRDRDAQYVGKELTEINAKMKELNTAVQKQALDTVEILTAVRQLTRDPGP